MKRGVLPLVILGVVLLAFWVLGSLLQIQTSEAFLLHGASVSFHPNWSVLMQPVALFQGTLDTNTAKAAMWGWGIELFFLVCILGYEIAHSAVSAANRRFTKLFQTVMIGIIAFDGWTDFQYGQLASGLWGQVLFAIMMMVIVMFFGVAGIGLIEYAVTGGKTAPTPSTPRPKP
jgi:hypothetical protein